MSKKLQHKMEVTNKQNEKMIKYEIQIKNCLDDLYQLGAI